MTNKGSLALIAILSTLLMGFQYQLWFGEHALPVTWKVQRQLKSQVAQNTQQDKDNQDVYLKIKALRHNPASVEWIARHDLGMIKPGEILYQIKADSPSVSEKSAR